MKVAIIGGGSTYTPELLDGLARRGPELGVERVVLHDVRADRLEPVAGFCARLAAALGSSLRVEHTLDRAAALDGAAFVVNQIRIGGQEGRHEDIRLGLDRGLLGQETTGVGGLAKALRTIPAALTLAEEVAARCPQAWLLNFSNPSGMVTEALLRHSGLGRVVGLCNVPIEMHMEVAALLGRPKHEVELDWVGLNHLGWLRRVVVDGVDILPGFIGQIESGVAGPSNIPELRYPPGFLEALGAIPSSYVRYFYAPEDMLSVLRHQQRSRAQEVMALEERLLEVYADPDEHDLPGLLSERGGAWYSRLAVDVMEALRADEPSVHIVNTSNRGVIAGLPDDAVVEVPCQISREGGVVPSPRGAVCESIAGLMQQVKAYERLGVAAAVERDRAKAYLALVAHPLVPDVKAARSVLDALIERELI